MGVPPLGAGPYGIRIDVNVRFDAFFVVALVQYREGLLPSPGRGTRADDGVVGNCVGMELYAAAGSIVLVR